MPIIQKQFELFVVALFLLSCSNNDLPTPTFDANTQTPSPSPTLQPTATISPTKTQIYCPPFEIDREIPNPNTPENYIGRTYGGADMPEGLEYHEGAVILGPDNHDLKFGFSRGTSMGNLHMIWFTKTICHNVEGKTYKIILDAIALPQFAENDLLGLWYCSVNGIDDPEIIALGEAQCGDRYLSNIKQAWRLNRQIEKIESIPNENVTCQLDVGECTPQQ